MQDGESIKEKGYIQTDADIFSLVGDDSTDFLERTVTNNISNLDVDRNIESLLLNPEGRTIAALDILRLDEKYLVSARSDHDIPEEWRENIFIEDIGIAEEPFIEYELLMNTDDLAGIPELGSIEPGEISRKSLGDSEIYLYLSGRKSRASLLVPRDKTGDIQWILDDENLTELSIDIHEIHRVRNGIPSFRKELRDRLPLETGAESLVSLEKGCYVGQEVIARVEQRGGGAPKTLKKLILKGEANEGEELLSGDKKVGKLTSVTRNPGQGWIGLGVINRELQKVESLSTEKTKVEVKIKGDAGL